MFSLKDYRAFVHTPHGVVYDSVEYLPNRNAVGHLVLIVHFAIMRIGIGIGITMATVKVL